MHCSSWVERALLPIKRFSQKSNVDEFVRWFFIFLANFWDFWAIPRLFRSFKPEKLVFEVNFRKTDPRTNYFNWESGNTNWHAKPAKRRGTSVFIRSSEQINRARRNFTPNQRNMLIHRCIHQSQFNSSNLEELTRTHERYFTKI